MMQEHYRMVHASTQLNKLVPSMWTDPDKPHQVYVELKAKGKETEHVCCTMLWIWTQEADGSDLDGMATMMLDGMCKFFDLCKAPGHFMSTQDANAMKDAVSRCLLAYTWLGNHYANRGMLLFSST